MSCFTTIECPGDATGSSAIEEQVLLRRRLRSSLHHTTSVHILLYCCTRIQYVSLATILFRLGRTDASIQNSNTTDACSMPFRDTGVMNFTGLGGNCESYCSLEQLAAPLCAAHKRIAIDIFLRISEDKRHHYQKMLYISPGLLYCDECICIRISRQSSNYLVTFLEQTLLELLSVAGPSAFCFGEQYRHLLYTKIKFKTLDFIHVNNTRYCTSRTRCYSYSTEACVLHTMCDMVH